MRQLVLGLPAGVSSRVFLHPHRSRAGQERLRQLGLFISGEWARWGRDFIFILHSVLDVSNEHALLLRWLRGHPVRGRSFWMLAFSLNRSLSDQ